MRVGYRGRFAPSPTGPLHLGSLLAAWASWLDARQHDGVWLVRIEDLDPPREIPGAAAAQLLTLARYGLQPDEAVVWQSQRHALYDAALERLMQTGQAFCCSCSRAQLAAHGGIHRHCLAAVEAHRHALRLRVADGIERFVDRVHGVCQEDLGRDCGDVVLRRADGLYAYQLAVVVDDAAQHISDVVRGVDLLASTARQRVLQRALGLPHPRTLHLPLALDHHGRKLSKSEGAADLSVEDPLAVLRRCWQLLGQEASCLAGCQTLAALHQQALAHFVVDRIPPTPPPAGSSHVPAV